jgi:hypothetical protein
MFREQIDQRFRRLVAASNRRRYGRNLAGLGRRQAGACARAPSTTARCLCAAR